MFRLKIITDTYISVIFFQKLNMIDSAYKIVLYTVAVRRIFTTLSSSKTGGNRSFLQIIVIIIFIF